MLSQQMRGTEVNTLYNRTTSLKFLMKGFKDVRHSHAILAHLGTNQE